MSERRFDDDEVARIFARATEVQREQSRAVSRQDGLSLSELQAIGKEAGIDPALIAQAARAVDQPPPPKVPSVVGIPVGVARTIELPRRLTDDEWERLVVRCRDLFEARGKVEAFGNFRQWTNGNLQVSLEPTGDGHRLRLRTFRGESRGLVAAGASMVLAASLVSFAGAMAGTMDIAEMLASALPLGLGGIGMAVAGLVRLPSWRRNREEQFERLAAEFLALSERPPR